MKDTYEKPVAEKIVFSYQEQVVAASSNCTNQWTNTGDDKCDNNEFVKNFNG